jgi:subtilisin family serine protease
MQGIANANTPPQGRMDNGPPNAPRGNRTANRGGRGSGVPPAGETRFVPNEVVAEISNATPLQVVAAAERRHRLSRVEQHRSSLAGSTLLRWRIADRRSVPSVIRALEADGVVTTAQPNYIYALSDEKAAVDVVPAGQYALERLNVPPAHRIARGSNVLVAVIDSGIDEKHPDLQGAVADRFNASASVDDSYAHGTAIAGLIAGRGRVSGTAPDARILAVRAFDLKDTSAAGTTFAILKGLDWSADKHARIINMSFAGPADPAMARALAAAARGGIVLIAAAGNAGDKSPPLYPAADVNVIAVAASDSEDKIFSLSNRGRHIAVAAPGVDILAPAVGGGYQVISGTSMSAAEISGIAALLLERKPNLLATEVRSIMTSTAKDIGAPGRDDAFGAGLADALQAVSAASPPLAGADANAASR